MLLYLRGAVVQGRSLIRDSFDKAKVFLKISWFGSSQSKPNRIRFGFVFIAKDEESAFKALSFYIC